MASRVGAQAIGAFGVCVAVLVGTLYVAKSTAQSTKEDQPLAGRETSPIHGIAIPEGYRDWHLISVAQLAGGSLRQLRAQLGNDIAMKAFREGKRPFPDGSMIAALHWTEVASSGNTAVLAGGFPGADLLSSVADTAVNVQFMVKDTRRYASTGGWGFADFKNGKPGDEALHKTCFPCHQPAQDRDFVFARYAPTP
jgi:hypothetical protein